MWQQRLGHSVKILAGTPTGQCVHCSPYKNAALITPGLREVSISGLSLAVPESQRRFLANRRGDQQENSEATPPAARSSVNSAFKPQNGASSSPVIRSSDDLAAETSKEAAIVSQAERVESIEDILIRTHKKELIQRVGPHVERYLPSEDPNAFLLPDNRLEPGERRWQKVFVALPWAVFACMLATPFLLVAGNLPWLQKRAEAFRHAREAREEEEIPSHLPGFEIVNFGQMPDVLERPFPTMVMIFHPSTFASKIFLPVLRDLADMFRAAGIAVSVAALDLSASPQPPHDFLWEYPPALAPHLQLVLPRARDGEAGVVDYDGSWNISTLAAVGRRLAGPYAPAVPPEDLNRLESQLQRFRDLLFELTFLGGSTESSGRTAGKTSWLGGLFATASPKIATPDRGDLVDLECKVDFGGGVAATVSSCEDALRVAQVDACRPRA